MDAFVNNPFRTQIHEAAAMALTAQKEMITLATGHMQRVGDEIFLFTPRQVSITAERVREETKTGSLFPID